MIAFPNSKLNLGLHIVCKRDDGFHDLETVFYPIPVCDALELISSNHTSNFPENSFVNFFHSGLDVPTQRENICVKAYDLLKKDFPDKLGPADICLHKAIPLGAGLGGGSSDGAFMLKLLNEVFALGLSSSQLIQYANQLGSDCPFFIINTPCLAEGRGEILTPVALDLSAYHWLLVNPGIHVNTSEAFSGVQPGNKDKSISTIIHQPVESWKNDLKNDFEESIFKKFPAIEQVKSEMYKAGALYASMTGSGSSVYGLFNNDPGTGLQFPRHYYVKSFRIEAVIDLPKQVQPALKDPADPGGQ